MPAPRSYHLPSTNTLRGVAEVIEVVPQTESLPDAQSHRIPPTLVTNVSDEMALMREEVFGAVLAILPYDTIDDVIDYVKARFAPLGSYWFGGETHSVSEFRRRTCSVGVTRNDFALHCVVDGLPFGGVGGSGAGYCYGKFGFDTFTHQRAVAEAPSRFSPAAILSPRLPSRMEDPTRRFLRWQQR